MFVKKLVTKGIASGVGLASEAYADRKEKKAAKNNLSVPGSEDVDSTGAQRRLSMDSNLSGISSDEDDVELAWDLDDAAEELEDRLPSYDEASSIEDPDLLAKNFAEMHFTSTALPDYKPLPYPVIVPQRRPKNKQRGFVRAYAPALGEAVGIDQQTFLDFLNNLDKASKASPIFDVINLACFAAGFAGGPIATGVTIGVSFAAGTAKELQSRYRRNHFLDEMNETVFKPRGVYCMIMTFQPDAPPVIGVDVTSTDQALARYTSEPDSEWRKKLRTIRISSGATKGEMSLPQAAPLIYPAIDAAADNPSAEKQNKLKSSGAFMNTYLDRRAQALYATTNADSKLVAPESERQFKSKYADPNHPIHAGTIWGLVTAGKFDPIAEKRVRKAQRRAARRGVVMNEDEIQAAKMGRKLDPSRGGRRQGRGPIGLVLKPVKKALKKDVLYLTIVNLPSESEMAEIRQELERATGTKGLFSSSSSEEKA
jgi:hypothetical protein